MTPKRKRALQYFFDAGEIKCREAHKDQNGPGSAMIRRMVVDRQLVAEARLDSWWFTLSDKGRTDLHEAAP